MSIIANDKISLDDLTDEQKSLLTRMSYLDIDMNKFEKFKQSGNDITVSDLISLLLNPNASYLGDMKINGSTDFVTGVDTSNAELLKQIEEAGLGDLKLVDIVDDSKSGFQGMCFQDSEGNTGFSFRGTDVKNISSFAKDGFADIEAFLTNNSSQISQATQLFESNCNENGQNYLYGHSLGGFLAENVYANNYDNIQNSYVINPLHINQEQLDTQEKIDAFNNSERFSCYVTGGDYVSTINSSDLFNNNVNYVQNSRHTANNIIGNHLIESAQLDENNNFVTSSREDAYMGYEAPVASTAVSIINNNKIKSFFSDAFSFGKKIVNFISNGIDSVKSRINSSRNNTKSEMSTISNPNNSMNKTNDMSYREKLKLENYVDGNTFTRADYEKAKEVISNPLKYINLSSRESDIKELDTTEKVHSPVRE